MTYQTIKGSRGFTLIEVLVSVLVLAIGLLGLASLQANSMKHNHNAYLRSQATVLAYDIIDRMRANISTAEAGNYDTAGSDTPSGSTNCQTGSCSATDMATFDINQWKCSVRAWTATDTDYVSVCGSSGLNIVGVLPGGEGAVVRNGDIYTVTVSYTERLEDRGAGTATEPVEIEVSTQL